MKAASLSIALDAMGGDRAPDMVVKGANIARQRIPAGALPVLRRRAADHAAARPLCRALRKASEIRHTDRGDRGRRQAVAALRAGRGSSMRLAIDAVQTGEAGGRRLRRQYRRADGDLQVRAADAAGHRPPGDRRVLPDPARRERDARSRRQCRVRRREPGAVRGHGRGLRPHRARARRSPPSACSMSARRS